VLLHRLFTGNVYNKPLRSQARVVRCRKPEAYEQKTASATETSATQHSLEPR